MIYFLKFCLQVDIMLFTFYNLGEGIYPFLARRLRPLRDTTEKLILHTIYSTVKLTNILYFVLIYTKKDFFSGIL